MKPIHLLTALAFGLSNGAFAAGGHDHAHEHTALHGGVVAEAKDIDFELVAKPDSLRLHVRDHGKPVDVAKASAKLTLLAGGVKQEVALKPAGDKLEAMGQFKVTGAKAVALVNLPGKPALTVRFVLR
ncbi:MAG TPA: hypothetical protein PKH69_04405 [Thiobacillaceae bacterium]|jgi:hypothetical protein|nr:hypothetical protein [Hydrogenophilales bacterium]MCU0840535.1 hypothetical protein [Thiobacillaceae bacterium]HNQ03832.1 hypothetical protein [Thiobacillaceae bacterium]HNU63650.1 hypothetical protein [Thiobacillaceae bacterium]